MTKFTCSFSYLMLLHYASDTLRMDSLIEGIGSIPTSMFEHKLLSSWVFLLVLGNIEHHPSNNNPQIIRLAMPLDLVPIVLFISLSFRHQLRDLVFSSLPKNRSTMITYDS
jgi:hypothetical protein